VIKTTKKILAMMCLLTLVSSIFPRINPGVNTAYAIGDDPAVTSTVYSVDENNLLISELEDNTVQADTFKSGLTVSPEGASLQVYAKDGTTVKTGAMVSGDKVKVSLNGPDKVYTVETYQIVNGEKIYPGFVAQMSGTTPWPGDDDATALPVPLGFNFSYFGQRFSGAYIDINGYISFNELEAQQHDFLNTPPVFTRNSDPYNLISAFLSDITMQNISEDKINHPQYVPSIYYKTIGAAPHRQFITQWTNMYFWQGDIQFADFQVILSEGSDKIQLQYRTLLDINFGVDHAGLGANACVGLKGPYNPTIPPKQVSYMIAGTNDAGQRILLHQGQAITFTPDGAGGYTMVDNDAQYEKVYLQNPLAPLASHICEEAGMTPDQAVDVSTNAKIGWEASDLATRYRLAVATTDTFADLKYNIDGLTDTYFQFGGTHPLDPDTTYYWKVESVNNNGSSFSPVYSFTTADDSALSSLSSDTGTWDTPFTPGTLNYTISVPYNVSSIAFTPIPVDAAAVVTVNGVTVAGGGASGGVNLNVGSNPVTIIVTPSAATGKTYTITVDRAPEAAPELTGFTWTLGNVAGTIQTTTVPPVTLQYVVGAAGLERRPNVGDSAGAYTNTLIANTNIAVSPGQHIYIAAVDGSGNIVAWADVAVDNINNPGGPETYTVNFDSRDGSTIASISNITAGASIRPPTAPTRAGYIFNGWYKEPGCVNAWNFSTDTVTNNITLYAGWTVAQTDSGGSSSGGSSSGVPSTTTVTGSIIDNRTGAQVSTLPATVATDSKGNTTVTLNVAQAVVLEQPGGGTSTLGNRANIVVSSAAGTPVTMNSDGTIQVSDLAKGTENSLNITYNLGNGQTIIIGTITITVAENGNVSLTSSLIDPYGILTDSLSGEPISGANTTLYYADTDRNKAAGKTPGTVVQLPAIDGFKPNNNQNPQTTDSNGAYGFMVYPDTDYYIEVSRDGYDPFTSPTIAVGKELVKFSAKLNPPVTGVNRVAGETRVDTALELAKSEFKNKVQNVVLATAENYPDALTGSVLAYRQNAPLLLIGGNQADKDKVLAYMKANADPQGSVYILGGTGAIDEGVIQQIKATGFANITRLGGTDRYETAAKVADYLKVDPGTPVILVSGENYPDALAVSSSAAINKYPILLVAEGLIEDSVQNTLAAIKPDKVYIIGEQGVISDNIKNQAEQMASPGSGNVVRIGGADRYETAAAIAKYFNLSGQSICVATGRNFPDALAGSIYAANFNAPIILVDDSISNDVINYVKTRKITGVTLFGGEAAVGKNIEQELLQMIEK
jgi:uncharacterized repeat protein (TIGR02543 family)